MEEKIAFVFDTNFIIKNHNLIDVLKKIDNKYVPYVTMVSIEERKAQQCISKKKTYEKIKELQPQIESLIILKSTNELETELSKFKLYIQKSYETLFDNHIIQYDVSSDMFKEILERAYNKIPPFNVNEGASDKGFKDSLMWLSIKKYFKENGENEVLFLSDDKGFIDHADFLIKEFQEYTGKKIQIKNNSIIDSLIGNKIVKDTIPKKEKPNIESIREQLQDLLDRICWSLEYNYYGDEEYYRNFLTDIKFDEAYIKSVLDDLESIIQNHLFSDKIQVSIFLEKDSRIYNDRKIDMILIEKLNKLYKEVLNNYSEHTYALITAITEKLNENYEKYKEIDYFDIPF